MNIFIFTFAYLSSTKILGVKEMSLIALTVLYDRLLFFVRYYNFVLLVFPSCHSALHTGNWPMKMWNIGQRPCKLQTYVILSCVIFHKEIWHESTPDIKLVTFYQQWTWIEYKQVKCILHIILENLFHALSERDGSVSIDGGFWTISWAVWTPGVHVWR